MLLTTGQYYPRIARGNSLFHWTPHRNAIVSAQQQYNLLCSQLESVLANIEPEAGNATAYGHTSRNLLILASTEFEAQCTGILQANHASPIGRHFNTNDYVKLATAMRLDKYEIALSMFPDYPIIKPFDGWNPSQPTQSLTWYDAYNKTKHDREANFSLATLENAITSVSACFAMLVGQMYGVSTAMGDLGRIFTLRCGPQWAKHEQDDGAITAVDYPF